jgi:hypothetical protein
MVPVIRWLVPILIISGKELTADVPTMSLRGIIDMIQINPGLTFSANSRAQAAS